MTLKVTDSVKVYRHPGATLEDDYPLPEGRRRYLRPLETHGTPDDPDVFELTARLPLEFLGDTPQAAGRRAKRIEADLTGTFDAFEGVEADTENDS